MQSFKFLLGTVLLTILCLYANAQDNTRKKQDQDEKRKVWVKANLATKQDAVDFIAQAYKDFTVITPKRSVETGIYKREVKFNDCELTIETESRQQESMWKSDHEFIKDIVVIDLDRVVLDSSNIKPSSPENAKGLFQGRSYAHFHKIPSYSILTAAPNRDANDKFVDLHYELHLQWAYQFLIDECTGMQN